MKKRLTLLLFLATLFSSAPAQTSMEKWKPLLQQPGLAEYFKGIFDYLGIKIIETGEQFTVHHLGTSFELIPGIDPSKVDFTVEIKKENVDNLVKEGADSKIDESESFKIAKVIFTPITQDELNNPFLTKKKYLRIAHADELMHVVLLDPEKKQDYTQTLIFVKDQWIVVEGLHGKTNTTFRLTPVQAVDFQRHLFEAKKMNTKKGWMKFMKWYKGWKPTVT
jgi:hypothetical protein